MEYRGPILLVFGASLIMSPIAVNIAMGNHPSREVAGYLQTENGANATCTDAAALVTGDNAGCRRPSSVSHNGNDATRRVMEGGAVFLSARH